MEFVVLGWPPDGPTLRLDYRRFAYAGKFVMSNTGKAVVREAGSGGDGGFEGGADADGGAGNCYGGADNGNGDVESGADDPGEFDDDVLAALAFNADRTDDATLWYRYVTVREDAKGSELGPRLAAFVAPEAASRGYDRIRIAVNNPFAYEAMYKAGFSWTGRETGVAELVLERPADGNANEGADEDTSSEADGNANADAGADPEAYRAGLDRFRERDLGEPEASFLADRLDAEPPERLRDSEERLANPDG